MRLIWEFRLQLFGPQTNVRDSFKRLQLKHNRQQCTYISKLTEFFSIKIINRIWLIFIIKASLEFIQIVRHFLSLFYVFVIRSTGFVCNNTTIFQPFCFRLDTEIRMPSEERWSEKKATRIVFFCLCQYFDQCTAFHLVHVFPISNQLHKHKIGLNCNQT